MTNKKYRNYIAKNFRHKGVDWATSHKMARAYNSSGDKAAAEILAKKLNVSFLYEDETYGVWEKFYGHSKDNIVFSYTQGNIIETLCMNNL